jgi:hypothetical protein
LKIGHMLPLLLSMVVSTILMGAQEKTLSPEARSLSEALVGLQNSPNDPAVQERYLKAFPQNYKDFVKLFGSDRELAIGVFDTGGELYDGHEFILVLPSLAKNNEAEVGRLVVQLGKDAHWAGDALNALQEATVVYGDEHTKTFAALVGRLSAAERANLVTFLAHAENYAAYPEYQTLIDHLKGIGQDQLAKEFEAAREKGRQRPRG